MGAGQSDLYKGTYGDNAKNIPDELQTKIKLPDNLNFFCFALTKNRKTYIIAKRW